MPSVNTKPFHCQRWPKSKLKKKIKFLKFLFQAFRLWGVSRLRLGSRISPHPPSQKKKKEKNSCTGNGSEKNSCKHRWLDLLTSRAFEREARSYERRSERAKARRILPHQTRKPCERLWESLAGGLRSKYGSVSKCSKYKDLYGRKRLFL